MYSVTVRGHFMIAHSFDGKAFGPAQKLHGATYVVDATLYRDTLEADGIVVGIDQFHELLNRELGELNLTNLDNNPVLAGQNTTTEFLAGHLFGRLVRAIERGEGGDAAQQCQHLHITLGESHISWASYEADL